MKPIVIRDDGMEFVLKCVDIIDSYAVIQLEENKESGRTPFKYIKLKLRPLSSLTKPITVEGYSEGSFIPIEEMRLELAREWCKAYDNFLDSFNLIDQKHWMKAPLEIINILLSWHFNLFFDEGEYIAI